METKKYLKNNIEENIKYSCRVLMVIILSIITSIFFIANLFTIIANSPFHLWFLTLIYAVTFAVALLMIQNLED